jgi:hypothetical protein
MHPAEKPTNPKDVLGSDRLPLDLVPSSLVASASLGFLEGALKYGRFNWRIAGVRVCIYLAACLRHIFKYMNGEECDPKTGVPHLSSAQACLGIIVDSKVQGNLIDDRPPRQPGFSEMIDAMGGDVKRLKALFADHHPKQYTIEDSDTPLP